MGCGCERGAKARLDEVLRGFEERVLGWGGTWRDIACLVVSAASIAGSLAFAPELPWDPAWVAIVLCGVPIVLGAIVALITEFDIKADVLVSLAIIASIATGEYEAAGVVAFIMQLGAFLEEYTVGWARAGIERLVGLSPRTARLVEGGSERVVSAESVAAGQVVRVLPGETVPVDGVVLSGETSIDQSVMTGEAVPVDRGAGDEVFSGTVNQLGVIEVRATRPGDDGSIQRMARLVQSADASKAKVVRTADRWATVIVVAALAIALAAWALTGETVRGVTVLVVFCPCALVLATPTAIMAAIGNATKRGFLTREGDALERLAGVTHVAFDKTGTLTHGRLRVIEVVPCSADADREGLLFVAASAERASEHPLGRAIVEGCVEGGGNPVLPDEFRLELGRGLAARVDGALVLVGNREMMAEHGVALDVSVLAGAAAHEEQGHTVSFVARDGRSLGFIALADTLREDAAETIGKLIAAGVIPVLLTGDNERVARGIADAAGIGEVHASCLPQDKMAFIEEVERTGGRVCMIGDGVNDAPALKRAYVGLAMGGVGSDIAADAADIVLTDDRLSNLPHLLALSRRTLATIRVNLTFSMGLNVLATALATLGLLGPVAGAFVHNIGSVLVIANSALLLGWKRG